MGDLLRAPESVGAWLWFVVPDGAPDTAAVLAPLAEAAAVLREHGLLHLESVDAVWEHPRGGRIDDLRTVPVPGGAITESLVRDIEETRPSQSSEARLKLVRTHGSGTWVDGSGTARTEDDLVVLESMPVLDEISLEAAVHHDVWARYAFSGIPHPQVYDANAPRLAAALQGIETVMGTKTEPGDSTGFGRVQGYGIQDPEPDDIEDGRAPDLTYLIS